MRSKKFLSVILSVVLVVGLMPFPASATQTDADDSGTWVTVEGTAGVDYVDGEVLVAVRGGQEALSANTPQNTLQALGLGDSSYSVVESLTTVSDSDIAQAADDTGTTDMVNLDNTSNSTASDETYSLQSVSDDSIEIVLLSCDDVEQTINDLLKLDCVVTAQPNYIYATVEDESETDTGIATAEAMESALTSTSMSDNSDSELTSASDGTTEPFYTGQWSLESRANLTSSGYPNTTTNLDVEDAWEAGAGNETNGDVVVAVIDCGVDYTHEDLKDNMWTGGDAAWSTALGGGTYGYNALIDSTTLRNDPMDKYGHGTHCASTIASTWNGTGVAGINNKVEIMAVRAIATAGESNSAAQILAFNYVITAKKNGVDVVATSNSYGPGSNVGYSDIMVSSMVYQAGEQGILSIFAAGNASWNNDLTPNFQKGNSNPYLIVVDALNSNSGAADFTQYGARSTDVFSPGTRVLAATTNYNSKAGTNTGMAAQYTPWLNGSASSTSSYFLDTAESEAGTDGITYTLVKGQPSESGVTVTNEYGSPQRTLTGYCSDHKYQFNLNGVTLGEKEYAMMRMTIPAATWNNYVQQGKGDNLYLSAIGNIVGCSAGYLVPLYCTKDGCVQDLKNYIRIRDGNWFNLSSPTSLSTIDKGKSASGDVTIYFILAGTGMSSFTSDNYFYLDNISLGWSTCSNYGTANANGSYYYSDGTSMATPNVSGVVSLLSSKAKVSSGGTSNYLQDSATAKEIAAFIKGGVTSVDALSDICKTGGVANAKTSYSAYQAYKAATSDAEKLAATANLRPVPDTITDNGDGTYTLSGSFFGNTAGTVAFNGTTLTVKSWSDTSITFNALSLDNDTIGKVVVEKTTTSNETVAGQSYQVMPASSSSTKTFTLLSNPDFEITYTRTGTDGQVTTFTTNANDVTPLKMASAGTYVYVYGTTASDNVHVLLRYNTTTGAWDTKNYLDGYSDQIFNEVNRLLASMTAGKSEIYLKITAVPEFDPSSTAKTRLFTIDANTGNILYNVALDNDKTNTLGSLGFYNGKLYEVGGAQGESVCSVIYPDTGEVAWSSTETLPVNAYYGTVTNNGSGLTVTASYNEMSADAVSGYQVGQKNQEMDISFNADGSTTLKTSTSVFFPEKDTASAYGLDTSEVLSTIGAAGIDGGVLMTGPVKGNETADMIDTWKYTTSNQTWSEITATRFAPALESSICSCTLNGVYYVMAQDVQEAGVFQKFGSYSLSALELSDSNVTPTSDALKSSSVGDLNNDNKVNITDAQVVTDMIAGNWTKTTSYDNLVEALKARGTNWDAISLTAVADANGDKVVNAEDARAIQNRMHTGSFTSTDTATATTQASATSTSVASVTSRASLRIASASSAAATSSVAATSSLVSDTTTTPSYNATWASAPQVKSGEDFSITLSLKDSSGENAVAFSSVSVNLDPTKVKLNSVSGADNIMTTYPTDGTALTSFYGNTQTGATLTYNFTALPESSGSAGISFASGSAGAPIQLDSYDVNSANPNSNVTITYSPNTSSSYDKTGVQLPDEACVPILFGVALLLMATMGAWFVYRKRKSNNVK